MNSAIFLIIVVSRFSLENVPDRQEDEGNVFAIEGDAIAEEALNEWRAACAALLQT
jgi:hypothetical protein